MLLPLATRKSRRVLRRADVTPAEWSDWRWQLRHRLETVEELSQFVELTDDERRGMQLAPALFRVGITPYYAELMDRAHPRCPVRLQVVPTAAEAEVAPGEYVDPLGEDALTPEDAPCIVHRYPDRVLFLALDRCAIYCRHCNRRRLVGQESGIVARAELEAGLDYIRRTPAIKDVLVSGGDPLTLSTEKLAWLLGELRAIEHVDILRIGTRVPVCLPMRVDDELCAALKRFHPLYINTHFNHPKEITDEARAACAKLADAGIPLGNQTVLLRRVNSDARVIEKLNRELLKMRVKPYYLFQGDPVTGTDHLRTPVGAGIEIMEHLRGRITGLGIPHLVIDAPGGGGKIPIGPNYVLGAGASEWTLRTWRNQTVKYVEPAERDCACDYPLE
ncbi:MAG TPA: KamA family radical SAM protein [Polyangia bacterium]|nr:KamA family radical SAM protein [Polyangia bacterium]